MKKGARLRRNRAPVLIQKRRAIGPLYLVVAFLRVVAQFAVLRGMAMARFEPRRKVAGYPFLAFVGGRVEGHNYLAVLAFYGTAIPGRHKTKLAFAKLGDFVKKVMVVGTALKVLFIVLVFHGRELKRLPILK